MHFGRRVETLRWHVDNVHSFRIDLDCDRQQAHLARLRCHVPRNLPLDHDYHRGRFAGRFEEIPDDRVRSVVREVPNDLVRAFREPGIEV